jgi:hypothetical protein
VRTPGATQLFLGETFLSTVKKIDGLLPGQIEDGGRF